MAVSKEMYFIVKGQPQGKGRPRFTRSGMAYTPKKTADYEQSVIEAYKQAENGCFSDGEPLDVYICALFGIPKSYSKKKIKMIQDGELLPTKKPDGDNIAKVICDALNGIAYKDDSQIVRLSVEKRYTEHSPRVIVGIYPYGKESENE